MSERAECHSLVLHKKEKPNLFSPTMEWKKMGISFTLRAIVTIQLVSQSQIALNWLCVQAVPKKVSRKYCNSAIKASYLKN